MWKIFKLGQGPRPDLLAEQWAREAAEEAEEEARERQQEEENVVSPVSEGKTEQQPNLSQEAEALQAPRPSAGSNDPAEAWIEEQRGQAEEKRENFQDRTESPKPTRKDFVAMCVAMAELLIPSALVLVGLFALLIFLLQKFWLHA